MLGNGNGYDSRFTAIMPSIIPLLVGLAVETPTEPCGAPVAPTTTEPPAPAPAPVATVPVAAVPVAATVTPRFTG